MSKFKNIIFDFDGVILDSVPVKTEAFRQLFKDFSSNLVHKFIIYHEENGGISRYIKIQYFFETLLKKNITETEIIHYANKYSLLTKQELSDPKYIITDTLNFIKKNHTKYNMHIASGADENDLKYICKKLNLATYFLSIHGSPTPKKSIVKNILAENSYLINDTILIGDSINDYDAAILNHLKFYGFNNTSLKEVAYVYLLSMNELKS